MHIGIRCSIAGPLDRFTGDHLRAFADHGFDRVELNFNRPTVGLHVDDADQARDLRAAADRLGIRLLAHAPDDVSLSLPDREAALQNAQRQAAFCKAAARFGVESIVLHACGQPLLPGQEHVQRKHLTQALHHLAEQGERLGVRVHVETLVPGRLTSSSRTLAEVVEDVASPWMGICLDTNHVNIDESLPDAIDRVAPWLGEVHLNDNHGEREEHLLPYRGGIDWPAVARSLTAAGFAGPAIMEPGQRPDWPLDEVLRAAREAADRVAGDMAAAGG